MTESRRAALRHVAEVDGARYARVMGCSPGAARVRLCQGMARLREELGAAA